MAAPTLAPDVTENYSRLVVEHLTLLNTAYAVVAYLNMGEVAKATSTLQGAIADVERSH